MEPAMTARKASDQPLMVGSSRSKWYGCDPSGADELAAAQRVGKDAQRVPLGLPSFLEVGDEQVGDVIKPGDGAGTTLPLLPVGTHQNDRRPPPGGSAGWRPARRRAGGV